MDDITNALNAINVKLDRNNDLLSSLISIHKGRENKEEKFLFKEVVVTANGEKQSDPINNPGYNKARIFLDAGFTLAHSGGLSVFLAYKNSVMGEVLKIISSNGSAGQTSVPIDVSQLSGFYFVIKNHDTSNDTTVKNFRIVLYNQVLYD